MQDTIVVQSCPRRLHKVPAGMFSRGGGYAMKDGLILDRLPHLF